jgi:hypothetical protein
MAWLTTQFKKLANPIAISTCALFILLLVLLRGCPKTQFEQAQARAEAGNPHWLSIELHTADQRHEYKESEFFKVVVEYSSAVRELYKAETGEGYSTVAATDVLHISDGRDMYLNIFGIVCCGSKLIGLNDEPYVYRPQLRLHLKPGTYEMYVTTRRVFPWNITPAVYQPSEWETASNMIKIRVVSDPGWQERELAKIHAKGNDPATCAALAVLDIPAATAQKLQNIRDGAACRSAMFNETEYATALKGLDQIMRARDYGVIQRDVNFTLAMRSWLAHPELRQFPSDEEARERFRQASREVFVAYEKDLVRELCGTLPVKTPDAKMITQHTIDGLTSNRVDTIPNCDQLGLP